MKQVTIIIRFDDLEACDESTESTEDALGDRIAELEKKLEKTQRRLSDLRTTIDYVHRQVCRL